MNDLTEWNKVKADYDKGYTDQELADKYNIKKTTVRVYRNRNKWGKANKHKSFSDNVVTENANVTDENVTKNGNVTKAKRNTKKETKLNDQQEYYCKLRAKGYPQSDAYRLAYDAGFEKPNYSIESSASRLEKQAKIMSRIVKLQENRAKHFKWTRDKAVDEMTEMYYLSKSDLQIQGLTKSNSDSVYNAFDRLNILLGLDDKSKLQAEKTKIEIETLKAKLQNITGSDNDQMQQVKTLLDDINKQL